MTDRRPSLPQRRQCCALLLGACLPGAAPQALMARPVEPELRAYTENLAPLSYVEDGQARGFSVELLRMMAAQARMPLRIEARPWQRALQEAARQPMGLLFPLARLPEREAHYQWVGPISPRRILLYRLTRRADVQPAGLAQLGGLRVGVARDSATAAQLQAAGLRPDTDLEFGLDDAHNLRKLLAGRMDLIALLDWAAAWQLRRLQLPPDALTPVLPLDVDKSYWYGLRADSDPTIKRRLQDALDHIRHDGRYEQLGQRYFGGS